MLFMKFYFWFFFTSSFGTRSLFMNMNAQLLFIKLLVKKNGFYNGKLTFKYQFKNLS